ncbi:glycosyltransferase [Novosphingobium sp.]|uniref:glycosyltransferase n=1 Tax=Novosphingobium sp. TaxID=1874826 RepID=UPI00286D3D7D|nr:glycosyltransferase [Novosphingobium sp.]
MNGPLRIAVPIHSFEPGGVERVALNLCAAWAAGGVAVTVVLGREDGAMAATAPKLDYALEHEPVPTARFETLWMMWRLYRHLRHNPTDVVFAGGNTYAVVAVVMKMLLGRRCPPLAIKISNDLYRMNLPAPARWCYRRWLAVQRRFIDHFVGMAEPMRAEIAECTGVADDRISIIEDPALAEGQYQALLALPRPSGGPRALQYLAIGRLSGQKNFANLLSAFALLPADARLTIVGEGPDRGKLERLANELGIAGRLAMPGHTDPAPYLAAASALVLSSDYEGVPAVVIEALAAGLPIAGTDCSVSMGSLLGYGQYGKLVPTRSPERLAEAMEAVLAIPFDPAAARASVAKFRIAAAATRYRALFAALAMAKVQPSSAPGRSPR